MIKKNHIDHQHELFHNSIGLKRLSSRVTRSYNIDGEIVYLPEALQKASNSAASVDATIFQTTTLKRANYVFCHRYSLNVNSKISAQITIRASLQQSRSSVDTSINLTRQSLMILVYYLVQPFQFVWDHRHYIIITFYISFSGIR